MAVRRLLVGLVALLCISRAQGAASVDARHFEASAEAENLAGLPRGTVTEQTAKRWFGPGGALKPGRFPRWSDCSAACLANATCAKFAWFQFDPGFPLPSVCYMYGEADQPGAAIGLPGFGSWFAAEVVPTLRGAANESSPPPPPPPPPCASKFFALPTFRRPWGAQYLIAYPEARLVGKANALADNFCKRQGGYVHVANGQAGAKRSFTLPAAFAAQAGAFKTFDPLSKAMCTGLSCPAYGVIECVPAGAAPCAPDAQGNIGANNTGRLNIGVGNVGDGNWGSRNVGDGSIGDGNTGSSDVGSNNTASSFFGSNNQPWGLSP